MWPCHVPTPALCPCPRNDRLWICMEFCGGGSLQEIYHGEGQDSRPQRATAFFPPPPNKGQEGRGGTLDLVPSLLFIGFVTLREILSFSGLCIPDCAGRGCGQHLFHLAVPAASPIGVAWEGQHIPQIAIPAFAPSFQLLGPWRNGRLPMSAERH